MKFWDNIVYFIWQDGKSGNHVIVFSKSIELGNAKGSGNMTGESLTNGTAVNPPASSQDNYAISLILLAFGIAVAVLFFMKRRRKHSEPILSGNSKIH
jgi:hypothetical protein